MLGRTLAVTRKEFLHIIRDRRTLVVVILIPIVQMVLLGYAATNDIEHLRLAILDSDETQASRDLIDAYRATGYFEIDGDLYAADHEELGRMIDSGDNVQIRLPATADLNAVVQSLLDHDVHILAITAHKPSLEALFIQYLQEANNDQN